MTAVGDFLFIIFFEIEIKIEVIHKFGSGKFLNAPAIFFSEVIKQVIAEKQVTKAELARRLGVKPQSVDYLLTRKSIDTDTLYSLSLALDYDFAVLYSIKKEHALATDEESPFKVGNAKISLEIELRPDEMLKLNLKQKIADLLEGKGK